MKIKALKLVSDNAVECANARLVSNGQYRIRHHENKNEIEGLVDGIGDEHTLCITLGHRQREKAEEAGVGPGDAVFLDDLVAFFYMEALGECAFYIRGGGGRHTGIGLVGAAEFGDEVDAEDPFGVYVEAVIAELVDYIEDD
jgi:hypothetical protein